MIEGLISRHYFRRTARRKAARLRRRGIYAVVVTARRGPHRWEVRGDRRAAS